MKTISLKPSLIYAFLDSSKFIVLSICVIAAVKLISGYFPMISDYLIYINALCLIPLLLAARNIIYWRMVSYDINLNQIKFSRGIFNYKIDYLELYRVKDFETQQPILLRIFKLMNLTLSTSDQSHPHLVLQGIPESNLPDIIRDLVQNARTKNRVLEVD